MTIRRIFLGSQSCLIARRLLLTFIAGTLLVACGAKRNIDEEDRLRRLFGGSGDGTNQGEGAPRDLELTDIGFAGISINQEWVKLDVVAYYRTKDDVNGYSTPIRGLYINTSENTVFVRDGVTPLKKIADVHCGDPATTRNSPTAGVPTAGVAITNAAPVCNLMSFSSTLKEFFNGDSLPKSLEDVSVTFEYERVPLDLELVDISAGPEKLISKFQGAKLSTSNFPEIYKMLVPETPTLGGETIMAGYIVKPDRYYIFPYQVVAPAANLDFDRCNFEQKDDVLLIGCDFLNPADKTLARTKQVLRHVKTK